MNIQALMKQAQQMQAKMQKIDKELNETSYEGTAGGGAVSVDIKGSHEVVSVTIDPELAADDIEMVQDMLVIAINDANKKIDAMTEKKMGKFGNIPGLF